MCPVEGPTWITTSILVDCSAVFVSWDEHGRMTFEHVSSRIVCEWFKIFVSLMHHNHTNLPDNGFFWGTLFAGWNLHACRSWHLHWVDSQSAPAVLARLSWQIAEILGNCTVWVRFRGRFRLDQICIHIFSFLPFSSLHSVSGDSLASCLRSVFKNHETSGVKAPCCQRCRQAASRQEETIGAPGSGGCLFLPAWAFDIARRQTFETYVHEPYLIFFFILMCSSN